MKVKQEKKLPIFIRDTREKKGHGFRWNKSKNWGSMVTTKLECGDYSIKGYEQDFVIERKGSASELIKNLITVDKERFHRELEILSTCKAAWIICEFDMKDLEKALRFINKGRGWGAKVKRKLSMEHVSGAIASINCKYKIPIIFASNNEYAKKLSQKLLLKSIKYLK